MPRIKDYRKIVIGICTYCGEEFEIYTSRIIADIARPYQTNFYCSVRCSDLGHRKSDEHKQQVLKDGWKRRVIKIRDTPELKKIHKERCKIRFAKTTYGDFWEASIVFNELRKLINSKANEQKT